MTLPPLAAEPLFHIAGFTITNSYVNSTLAVIGFAVFGFLMQRSLRKQKSLAKAPHGLVNLTEAVLEGMLSFVDRVTHDRKKSIRFLPLVGTLFLFILVSNWAGLLPGTGSFGIYGEHGGHIVLFPFLRPANADINMTLAMAFASVLTSHVLGVAAIGFFRYANKFIKLGDIWHAVRSAQPVAILTAIVEFFVGLIEVFSEVAKMLSLSLRLFGNIFAGEVLLTVIASLVAYGAPLPFMALELLVGIVQAMVFSLLTLVYLTIATTEIHEHDSHGKETEPLESIPTV